MRVTRARRRRITPLRRWMWRRKASLRAEPACQHDHRQHQRGKRQAERYAPTHGAPGSRARLRSRRRPNCSVRSRQVAVLRPAPCCPSGEPCEGRSSGEARARAMCETVPPVVVHPAAPADHRIRRRRAWPGSTRRPDAPAHGRRSSSARSGTCHALARRSAARPQTPRLGAHPLQGDHDPERHAAHDRQFITG